MNRLAVLGWKSGDSRNRRKNSYTSCRCGQAASNVGSSSSGSNSAPVGLVDGGNVRKRFTANYKHDIINTCRLTGDINSIILSIEDETFLMAQQNLGGLF